MVGAELQGIANCQDCRRSLPFDPVGAAPPPTVLIGVSRTTLQSEARTDRTDCTDCNTARQNRLALWGPPNGPVYWRFFCINTPCRTIASSFAGPGRII